MMQRPTIFRFSMGKMSKSALEAGIPSGEGGEKEDGIATKRIGVQNQADGMVCPAETMSAPPRTAFAPSRRAQFPPAE